MKKRVESISSYLLREFIYPSRGELIFGGVLFAYVLSSHYLSSEVKFEKAPSTIKNSSNSTNNLEKLSESPKIYQNKELSYLPNDFKNQAY